jgi:hypothetical protein
MRILALEVETGDGRADRFADLAVAEAARLFALVQAGVVRETFFRTDRPEAVLTLECADLDEARAQLATLPFVEHGLIRFELIGLRPYPGFARLFAGQPAESEA